MRIDDKCVGEFVGGYTTKVLRGVFREALGRLGTIEFMTNSHGARILVVCTEPK
jgi:hypothetical protein